MDACQIYPEGNLQEAGAGYFVLVDWVAIQPNTTTITIGMIILLGGTEPE
ncbi:hypothetical protein P3C29_06695 [Pseudomonas sp. 1912-s]|nr:hypothetical protein [Pseudomonas sp. 1912-s]MDF3198361.1 hypothetical protein [Pseudomonas sp. 1912-s]